MAARSNATGGDSRRAQRRRAFAGLRQHGSVCLSSHTDTFGNVVLEAMASGVPAIVTPGWRTEDNRARWRDGDGHCGRTRSLHLR